MATNLSTDERNAVHGSQKGNLRSSIPGNALLDLGIFVAGVASCREYAASPKVMSKINLLISGQRRLQEWGCKEALDSLRIISYGASRLGVVPADQKAPSGVYRYGD